MSRASPQAIVFSYHKSGTSLFLHVMTKVCQRLGLTLTNQYGLVEWIDPEADVVLLPHSLLRCPLERPYRAIRLIRDPRDMWVSAYLYHLRCDEGWCVNTDLDPTPPIGWPQVDYSVAHWPEAWKRSYLARLDGRSYQQNLHQRSLAEGLDFELEGYTRCTLTTLREWKLNRANALDVKLEAVMADFDGQMRGIFRHFGFTPDQQEAALEVARTEDVRRMDESAIAQRPQIHSRTISKWREILTPVQVARFEALYGDLIRELGYELTRDSPTVDRPSNSRTTPDAAITLSVDGRAIRPTSVNGSVYVFVVPRVSQSVRLDSRVSSLPASLEPNRLGVKVSEIAIRSNAGEVVIAADDPRLASGWYNAEQAGSEVLRYTNGSAVVPWDQVHGPAVVTVRCETLAEYLISDATPYPTSSNRLSENFTD